MPKSESTLHGLDGLDKLLEHRVRLAILVLASSADAITFRRYKELLGETDGSLGTHLRKLEDAGYLNVKKAFRDRRPVTWYSLAPAGRLALKLHTESLGQLLSLGS